MAPKKIFRLIHLYIGIISGTIVFVEAVTGALWVFNEEISALTTEEVVIQKREGVLVTPSEVRQSAERVIPDRSIHGVLYPNDDTRPIEVIFYQPDPEFYQSLFLDPYTAEPVGRTDHLAGFFAFILDGHLHLWLPEEIGEMIVSYGTLLFLFSIITGLILWWPKNKKGRRQRFSFDWKTTTRWRRKNFDLHSVVGFYVSALAMIFVITGLVMALNWFYALYYTAIGGEKEMRFIIPENVSTRVSADSGQKLIDQLPQLLLTNYSTARDYEIHFPHSDSSSIYVEISYRDGTYYDSDYVFFDQKTLKEIPTPGIYGKYEEADASDHMMRMNYDIHVGAIGGLPTKILAFLACLVIASLPVTGGLLWLGRKRKSSSKLIAVNA